MAPVALGAVGGVDEAGAGGVLVRLGDLRLQLVVVEVEGQLLFLGLGHSVFYCRRSKGGEMRFRGYSMRGTKKTVTARRTG
jgi:hypothetical protein